MRRFLVVYFRSGRSTVNDMGPLGDSEFRQLLIQPGHELKERKSEDSSWTMHASSCVTETFDVVVGDFNAVAEEAQVVVQLLAQGMGCPKAASIGTRKSSTLFQTQQTKTSLELQCTTVYVSNVQRVVLSLYV